MSTIITYETDYLPPPQLVLPDINEVMSSVKSPAGNDDFLNLPYVPIPKGFENVGSFELNNLTTAKDIATLQDKVNKNAEMMYQQSTVRGLTLRNGVQDMREAITGIFTDLYKNDMKKVSVGGLFTKGNRLRGLGLLLVLASISYILFITFG
jgi:hypothetical protein